MGTRFQLDIFIITAESWRNIKHILKKLPEGSQMSKKTGKNPIVRGMTYGECVDVCIAIALDEQREDDAAIYRALPIPSDDEWYECLQDVANEPSENLENPFHCMGVYEMRLVRRGIPTVLGKSTSKIQKGLEAAAVKVGMPVEFLPDALELFTELHKDEIGRNKKLDN